MGAVLKHYKVPEYYDQDYLEIFLMLSTLPLRIQVSGKAIIVLKKDSSAKKPPISKTECFLRFNLD